MFTDGDNGENFMTVLGFPQFGNLANPNNNPDIITRSSNSAGTFPEIWKEERQPTVDTFVMQKLNELEQEVKALKEEIKKLSDERNRI